MAAILQVGLTILQLVIALTTELAGADLLDYCEIKNPEVGVYLDKISSDERGVYFQVHNAWVVEHPGIRPDEDVDPMLRRQCMASRSISLNPNKLPGIQARPRQSASKSLLNICRVSPKECPYQVYHFTGMLMQTMRSAINEPFKRVVVKFMEAKGRQVIQVEMFIFKQRTGRREVGEEEVPLIETPFPEIPCNSSEPLLVDIGWIAEALKLAEFRKSDDSSGKHVEEYFAGKFDLKEEEFNKLLQVEVGSTSQ